MVEQMKSKERDLLTKEAIIGLCFFLSFIHVRERGMVRALAFMSSVPGHSV